MIVAQLITPCILTAHRFRMDLPNWRDFEVNVVIDNGQEQRAVVPKYSQCRHPWREPKQGQVKEVRYGDQVAALYPCTLWQYSRKIDFPTPAGGRGVFSEHRRCSCFRELKVKP